MDLLKTNDNQVTDASYQQTKGSNQSNHYQDHERKCGAVTVRSGQFIIDRSFIDQLKVFRVITVFKEVFELRKRHFVDIFSQDALQLIIPGFIASLFSEARMIEAYGHN